MDGDAPEPIEVELVAHDPRPDRGSRWRREPDPVGVEESVPEDEQVRRAKAERSRLVLVAAVAAVLALVLGWMIGRASTGESDVVADDASDGTQVATTVAAPFETLPIVGEEIGGADFEEPAEEEPSGSASSGDGPTTSEVLGPTFEPIGVDQRLAGVPIRLVGVEQGGTLVEADLATGTLTAFTTRGGVTSDGSPLVVGPDWVVSSWNGTSRVTAADGTTTEVDLGDSWQPLHVPGTDLFWRSPRPPIAGNGPVYRLVDLSGDPVGPELELPINSWPILVDPASGGLVVGVGSRSYVVRPEGVDYLGLGAIIGVASDVLVTYDCDPQLVCSLFRIDRATGEATAVPPHPELAEPYQWGAMAGWGGGSTATLSPDGRWVAVIGSTWNESAAGIVELATGRFVELAQLSAPPFVAWSPDGRFAYAIDGQTPVAYDTATGELFPVFTDPVNWSQLGARPTTIESAGSDGGTLLRVVPGATNPSVVAEETVEG